jgi:hypothetical protein
MKIKEWFDGEGEEKKEKNGAYLRIFKRGSTAQSAEEFKN